MLARQLADCADSSKHWCIGHSQANCCCWLQCTCECTTNNCVTSRVLFSMQRHTSTGRDHSLATQDALVLMLTHSRSGCCRYIIRSIHLVLTQLVGIITHTAFGLYPLSVTAYTIRYMMQYSIEMAVRPPDFPETWRHLRHLEWINGEYGYIYSMDQWLYGYITMGCNTNDEFEP
jgi:hypothetical protein